MTPTESTPASPELETLLAADEYLVQAGDTLTAIANRFGVRLIDLMNHNAIADARNLRAGQRLRIPGLGAAATLTETPPENIPQPPADAPTTEPTPTLAAPGSRSIYIVRDSDTIDAIAQRFNTTVPALLVANNMTSPADMTIGQRLVIPNSALVLSVAEANANAPRASDFGVLGVGDPTTPVVSPQEIQDYLRGKRTTFYVTRDGDTMTRVAALFQTDPLILSQINQVTIDTPLTPGTRLLIPLK